MRILFVNDEPSELGGKEKYLAALGAALSEAGHVTGLIHTRPVEDSKPVSDEIRFRISGLETYRGTLKTIGRFRECAELFKPDVIHIHHNARNLIVIAWVLRNFPVLRSVHDVAFLCPIRYYIRTRSNMVCDAASGKVCLTGGCLSPLRGSSWSRLAQTNLAQHVYRRWARLNTQSHFLQSGLIRTGFNSAAVQTLPVFVSDTASDEPAVRRAVGMFLWVGRLHPLKGPQVAVEAMKLLPPQSRLEIVGAGSMKSGLESTIRNAGLAARVTLSGYLKSGDLRGRYRQATALIVSGSIPENCPLVIQEAMLEGMPVIAANVGGIPELVTDGETGYLVPPNDPRGLAGCMQRLLDDPELADRLGANGKRRIAQEKYQRSYHIAQLVAEYQAAIDHFGRTRR